jgi:CheY-like chemotaxis protein
LKILIVEDELLIALRLELDLRRSGYSVCARVGSGHAAVQAALTHLPDVILLDIRLSGKLDGIDAAAEIAAAIDTSMIFMTGYQDEDSRERAGRLHPLAFMVKPVPTDHLMPLLADLENRRRAEGRFRTPARAALPAGI